MMDNPTIKETPRSRPRLSMRRALWRDLLEIVFLVIAIYTGVNLGTARAIVDGASMRPNFDTGQLVIINRFAYFFGGPARGDVIVLHNPVNPAEDFIKRVIGLPNETLRITEGRVYVNGTLLEEPYVQQFCGCDGTWKTNADQYFVLGDNRPNSYDSHRFGPIKRSLIVGQAWLRYWPFQDFGVIPHPRYTVDNHAVTHPVGISFLPDPRILSRREDRRFVF